MPAIHALKTSTHWLSFSQFCPQRATRWHSTPYNCCPDGQAKMYPIFFACLHFSKYSNKIYKQKKKKLKFKIEKKEAYIRHTCHWQYYHPNTHISRLDTEVVVCNLFDNCHQFYSVLNKTIISNYRRLLRAMHTFRSSQLFDIVWWECLILTKKKINSHFYINLANLFSQIILFKNKNFF